MYAMLVRGTAATMLLLAACPSGAEGAPSGRFGIALGADYSTGKYGGTQSTDVAYFPVMARYETDRWLVKLTMPYVRITGPGTVVGGDRPIVIDAGGSPQRRTESGLGDIGTSVTYSAIATSRLFLDLTAKIKWGTADESVGLGTGKNDYALQTDVYKPLGAFTVFAGIGYRWYGDPPGSDLRNVAFASAGGVYKFGPRLSAGASFDYRQPIISGRDPIRELTPFVAVKLGDSTKVQIYTVRGFSDASSDWGAGAVLIQSF